MFAAVCGSNDLAERLRRQAPILANDAQHHPIFDQFEPWSGQVDPGWDVNFLGSRTRVSFFSLYEHLVDFSKTRTFVGGLPIPNEDYFEWITLLEAVAEADGLFTMVELGAGWGKWLVNGAVAARRRRLPYRLIGVESEPTHFRWMKRHMADNRVTRDTRWLVKAAVAADEGHVWFHVGEAADWYGQAIANAPPDKAPGTLARVGESLWRLIGKPEERSVRRVRAVTLESLLRDEQMVDLIDIDVQGAEADVLEPAAEVLDEKVRRIFVGTHSRDNEERVRQLFSGLGWSCSFDFPGSGESDTPWGRIHFEDGVQAWRNPTT
ncbi:MAG: FkbM family methyltransferase [Actinobacteria bacterium]|nr:FkbM family methyltransferase [Actinomycetota bacterium]